MTRTSSLLIAGGLLVFVLAVFRGVSTFQYYNSPFDQVDSSSGYEEGFLPLLSSESSENQGVGFAPSISAPAQSFPASDQHPVVTNDRLQGQTNSLEPAEIGSSGAEVPIAGAQNPDGELFPSGAGSGSPNTSALPRYIPDRIVIPAIGVDGPIQPVGLREIEYKQQNFQQWTAPDTYAAGWHNTSAPLGIAGNTVLNGHHNAYGEIFKDLTELKEGDLIYLHSGDKVFTYKVGLSTRFNERFRPVEERLDNARWILPSPDERLTIITCWPYESNTHRVLIVAIPDRTDSGTVE
jgi:LPXTG-site transpeptidase (sortase) family protein